MTIPIRQELISILVANQPELSIDGINDETRLASLGIDSLAFVQLVFDIEQRYDIFISEDELDGLVCVGDLVALLSRHGRGMSDGNNFEKTHPSGTP
jgi:acyl carrier protein